MQPLCMVPLSYGKNRHDESMATTARMNPLLVASPRFLPITLLALVALAGLFAYWPGLTGGFVFDDINNLVENDRLIRVKNWEWSTIKVATWSSDSGILKRPVSMLTFAMNHATSGMNPFAFKLTNILIHVLAGLGVFVLARRLLTIPAGTASLSPRTADWVAVLAAALWLLHPLQLTSVLYIVQRMTSLASLFMIWGMASYAAGRSRQITGKPGAVWIAAAYVAFLPLAALSKENGLLLPLLVALVEFVFFRLRGLSLRGRQILMLVHSCVAVLPVVSAAVYLLLNPDRLLSSYASRDFTLADRVLTEARVLWFYLSLIVVPDTSRMGLYHDDFTLSTSLLSPPGTLAAVLALVLAGIGSLVLAKRWPVTTFAVWFFLIGHAMESSIIGLELVHEHRNYLPSFGVVFAIAWGIGRFAQRSTGMCRASIGISIAILGLLGGLTTSRAEMWGDDLERALVEARNHPGSPRTHIDAGVALATIALHHPNRDAILHGARAHFKRAAELDRYAVSSHLGLFAIDHQLGKPVDFALYEQIVERLRTPPVAAVTPDAVIQLIRCQYASICNVDRSLVYGLVKALASNPALRPLPRAQLFTESLQLALKDRDTEAAAAFALAAVQVRPEDAQIRLNLAATLLSFGEFDAAREQIELARRYDTDNFHRPRIAKIEADLEYLRHTGPHPVIGQGESEPPPAAPNR